MIQTIIIIICLSIIAIVALICYTSYKMRTFMANHEVLEKITEQLDWLKSDYRLNSQMLDKVWYSLQEIKECLQK